MTDLLTIVTAYKDFTKEFFDWYGKHYTIPIKSFIALPEIMQCAVIHEYIILEYNVGVLFDIGTIVLYYFKPELNVNEIIVNSKKKGKFTFNIYEEYDMKVVTYKNSFKRAILKAIEIINQPF